jgi:hypothetical protein
VFLESSLPAGAADRDSTLWHATITGDSDTLRLERRKGAGDAMTIEPTPAGEDSPRPRPQGVVYLVLGAPVTAQALGSVAARLEARGFTPIAVAGDAVPGRPSERLAVTGSGTGLGAGRSDTASRVARVRMGSVSVSGRLPPEVIQRIVRQNFGRFRLCYEKGLEADPKLAGRVAVRFVIGRDGAVSNVADAGSDMNSPSVVSCVTRAFQGLSFPEPEGGIVSVTYPIIFSPPEPSP